MSELTESQVFAARLSEALDADPERTATSVTLLEEHLTARLATKTDVAALAKQVSDLRDEIGREADGLLLSICREMGTSASLSERELDPILRRHAIRLETTVMNYAAVMTVLMVLTVLLVILFG